MFTSDPLTVHTDSLTDHDLRTIFRMEVGIGKVKLRGVYGPTHFPAGRAVIHGQGSDGLMHCRTYFTRREG